MKCNNQLQLTQNLHKKNNKIQLAVKEHLNYTSHSLQVANEYPTHLPPVIYNR